MFVVGELNDKEMAQRILSEYELREIKGHFYFSEEVKSSVIAVENEEHLAVSLDIYRVMLGLKKPTEIDPEWIKIKSTPKGILTKYLIYISLALYGASFAKTGPEIYNFFQIDPGKNGFLDAVSHGQIWRLLTPIFLHMSFLHILFNMLWLNDLGNIFEFKFGKKTTVFFVIICGIFSNLFQYIFVGPSFGGMSGVIYGMLAFIWIRKKIDKDFEYSLPKHDIIIMIGWFFLCLFGVLPNIANYAHAGGIFIGILWSTFIGFKLNIERIKYIAYAVFVLVVTISVDKLNFHF